MALLRQRGGGLLATGPDAVRANAMREQQRLLGAARAPSVISAPRPILEENPLNSLGQGLGQLGKSLGDMALNRRTQAARQRELEAQQALKAAGNDVNALTSIAASFPDTKVGQQASRLATNAFTRKQAADALTQKQLDRDLLIKRQRQEAAQNLIENRIALMGAETDRLKAQGDSQSFEIDKKPLEVLAQFASRPFDSLTQKEQMVVRMAQESAARPRQSGFSADGRPLFTQSIDPKSLLLPGQQNYQPSQVGQPPATPGQGAAAPAQQVPAPNGPDVPPQKISDLTRPQAKNTNVPEAVRKETVDLTDHINKIENSIEDINTLIKLNPQVPVGKFEPAVRDFGTFFGISDEKTDRMMQYDNLLMTYAISQLKTLFGSQLSDGERKAFEDLQGLSAKPVGVRDKILRRSLRVLQQSLNQRKTRLGDLQQGRGLARVAPSSLMTMKPADIRKLSQTKALELGRSVPFGNLSNDQAKALRDALRGANNGG